MVKPSEVKTIWVDKASLYKTKDGKNIASLSVSKVGFIITWHEFIPQQISQRVSTIWDAQEAAEFVILAAHAEAVERLARKEAKEASK